MKTLLAVLLRGLVFSAGFAALSWEVLWQLQATLALGASARGTAIVLATVMAGMSLGALGMGRLLEGKSIDRPLRRYAWLELTIGLSGLMMLPGFHLLDRLDREVYRISPALSPPAHALGIALVIGLPCLAMGATIPLLGLVARSFEVSLSRLYALNTIGAAVGCLALAFGLMPALGVYHCSLFLATVNALVAVAALMAPPGLVPTEEPEEEVPEEEFSDELAPSTVGYLVFLTGFVTFALEVSWFRALRAAFQSTSESFALMLASVLLALALGARLASSPRWMKIGVKQALLAAGALIILATPAIDRFDIWAAFGGLPYLAMMGQWFGLCLITMGPPIVVSGLVLPRLLDRHSHSGDWARLYALNTGGAILGSLVTAWVLLPAIGDLKTSVLVGVVTLVSGAAFLAPKNRLPAYAVTAGLAVLALSLDSGAGITRVQGRVKYQEGNYKILKTVEAPDSTVSTVELGQGNRVLVIDGFEAAGEREGGAFYMRWMGHLPMLMHPHPKKALIICFGTGQTVNGVRREEAEQIDVVDISATVLSMADYFAANEGVLHDPRVTPHVMDGRAWLRRTQEKYDVITLEPMPPNYAGVNNLYSKEFYDLCYERLNDGGMVAQWLPFQLVPTYHSASIATTFHATFPNSGLWLDPMALTGILVGRKGDQPINDYWPGLQRDVPRDLTGEQIKNSMALWGESLERYASLGAVITDDNQLLNHGLWRLFKYEKQKGTNLCVVQWATTDPPPGKISSEIMTEKFQLKESDLQVVPPYRGPK